MRDKIFNIDLQLFAEADTMMGGSYNMNTHTTTTSGLSAEMKTFYDMSLIDEAKPNLVYQQFGQKRPIPKNGGKIIEFRKFASLPKALEGLQEGVTPDGTDISVSTITAQVEQYGAYTTISDILDLTAIDNTIVEVTKLHGSSAGSTLDTVVRDIVMKGNNVLYADKVVDGVSTVTGGRAALTAACLLTPDMIRQAVRKLKSNNAPTINGEYVGIIHPDVSYDLMSNDEWIDAHKYATPENIYNGEIGKIAGVRFVETTEAKIFKDSTTPSGLGVYATLIVGSNAYGVTEVVGEGLQTLVKQKGSGGTSDPLDQRSTVGWKGLLTAEVLVDTYMVRVESCSKYSAEAAAN